VRKAAKIILIAAGSLLAVLLLAFALINTPLNKLIVKRIAAEYIGGTLDYDRLRISVLPTFGIRTDSLSLVSDKCTERDTLLAFSELKASIRLWALIRGEYDVPGFETKGLYVHYNSPGDGKHNWNIFSGREKEKNTASVVAFPKVNMDLLSLAGSRVRMDLGRAGTFDIPFDVLVRAKAEPSELGDGMNVSVGEFSVRVDSTALGLDISAEVEDLFGVDPRYTVDAGASLALGRIIKLIPPSLGLSYAAGNVRIELNADAMQSELSTYKFHKARISGSVAGDRLAVSIPADSLKLKTWEPSVSVESGPEGLEVGACFDSVYVEMGSRIVARVRDMNNSASITKVESHGRMTPRMAVSTDAKRLFVQLGSGKILTSDVDVTMSAQKHVSVVRDSAGRRRSPDQRPDFLEDESLKQGDVTFSLDSTLTAYLKEWDLAGRMTLGDAGYASPRMPLRTRLYGTDINFTGNEFVIDSLHIKSGTSDLSLKGSVKGLRRALTGKGPLRTELDIDSRRLNVNEIVSAMDRGRKRIDTLVAVADEADESFVVDSLSVSVKDSIRTGLVIVPANVIASVNLFAEEIDVKDIVVDSMTSKIRMQERTVQMTDTRLASNYGRMELDAFYSTRSRKDIQAGLNLDLSEVSASQIIGLLPTVDNMMPALKSFQGILGCRVCATAQLDANMNVLVPTLDGMVSISGKDLYVRDAGDLRRVTRLLLFKDKNIGRIDNLKVSAVVHDNKVEVFPFELGVDRYRLALYGMQGFDNTMYYHVSILQSPFIIRFGINIFGTTDNWRFRLCWPRYKPGQIPGFENELDNIHVNIVKSISNVFRDGVARIRRYNRRMMSDLEKTKEEKGFNVVGDGGDMGLEDQTEILDIVIDEDFGEADKALEKEVDAILAQSYKDTEKIMKEYARQAYQQGITRQIEKLKAQSEKKKASAKNKNR